MTGPAPPAPSPWRAPDGALLTARAALEPYLGAPAFANFLPGTGVLVVHAAKRLLVVLDGDRRCEAPLEAQRAGNRDALDCRALENDRIAELETAVRALWLSGEREQPGVGIILLVDRGMARKVAFDERGPRAALDLLERLGL